MAVPPCGVVPGPHGPINPKEHPMATVTIHRTDGTTETIPNVPDEDTAQYDSLPFTDPTVSRTTITL